LSGVDEINALALEPGGSILVLAGSDYGSNPVVLARVEPDGSLDPSFGTGGLTTIDLGQHTLASQVAIQTDGKVLVAGETDDYTAPQGSLEVARFDATGTPDPSFGTAGVATVNLGAQSTAPGVGLLVQPDQRIVVSGLSRAGFATARFNTDGSLDGSFGSAGEVVTSVPDALPYTVSSILQPDGRIVLSGSIAGVALVRYNADGSLDSSFGAGGMVTDRQCCFSDNTLALQSDGKLVVAGQVDQGFAATRFNQDGTVDAAFGSNGIAAANFSREYASVRAAFVDASGAIELAGHTGVCLEADHLGCSAQSSDISVARFTSTGSLDPAFGTGGTQVTNLGSTKVQASSSVEVLLAGSDGSVVAVGAADTSLQSQLALARYLPNGLLDPSFGSGGRVVANGVVPIGGLMQRDGKVVVVAKSGLLRYDANGSPDDAFGDHGVVTVPSRVKGAALSDAGFVVAGNTCCLHGDVHATLERRRSNGSLDRSFGDRGSFVLPRGVFAPPAIVVQRGGRIVVVGRREMLAITPKGRLDRSFGHHGRASVSLAAHERITTALPSGRRRILIIGEGKNGMVLHRYLPTGHPDGSFGKRGTAVGGVPAPETEAGAAVTHGKIVVATLLRGEPALARFNSDGSPDRSFGDRGRVTTGPGGRADAVALTPGPKIVLGGDTLPSTTPSEFLLARFSG
jgi:uncharacterized delta-60 repeat protein